MFATRWEAAGVNIEFYNATGGAASTPSRQAMIPYNVSLWAAPSATPGR